VVEVTLYDEKFLGRVFDSVTDPMAIYDREFRILRVNQTLAVLFRQPAEEIIGRCCYEVFYKNSGVCPGCHVKEVFRTGEQRMVEKLIPLPDGRKRLFEVHSYPVKDDQGVTIQAIEHARDVTETKSLDYQLRVSEEKYRTVVEMAQEGIFILDPRARITYVNGRFAEMVGYTPGEIRDLSLFDFMDEHTLSVVQFGQMARGSISAREVNIRRRDGSNIICMMSISPMESTSKSSASVGIITDISHLKGLEAELRSAKEFSEKIIHSITDSFTVVDPRTYRIVHANTAFHSRVGLEPPTATGKRCYQVILGRPTPCESAGTCCPVRETARRKRAVLCDKIYPDSKGEERMLEVSAYPIADQRGEVALVVRLERDVTEKRKMQEALVSRSRELQRKQQQLEALFEVSVQVNAKGSVAELVEFVHEMTREILPDTDSLLFLLDAGCERFLQFQEGKPNWAIPLARAQEKLEESGLVLDFIRYLQQIREPNISSSKDNTNAPPFLESISEGYASWFGLPISTPQQCIGYFLLGSPASQEYSGEDLQFFLKFFNHIAGHIRRLILYEAEIASFRQKMGGRMSYGDIIGESNEMQKIYDLIDLVAGSDATVLITGENGTGKELVATAVHNRSHRRNGPFVVANCSAYPPTLLESEIFGHEKGAFTGAIKRKKGRIERAQGGTLFLDEIGTITPATQVLLLRFLQDHCFERVGGEETVKAQVRILVATNLDLHQEVAAGRFREDLYYRLNVISIHVPSLRERKEDIPLLSKHFLEKFNLKEGKNIKSYAPEAMQMLLEYDWPGNVRQLENVVSHAVILARGEIIQREHLPHFLWSTEAVEAVSTSIADHERRLVARVLQEANWNKHEAARRLGVTRSTLYSKIRRYDLRKEVAGVQL
jgi:PAS domain S-box-containing protein